jgi:Zonular occludens toxin (Zot)
MGISGVGSPKLERLDQRGSSEEELRDIARESRYYDEELPGSEVLTPEGVRDALVREQRARVADDKDTVQITSGPPGSGKSAFEIWYSLSYDPTFEKNLRERCITTLDGFVGLYDRYGRERSPGRTAFLDEQTSMHLQSTQANDPIQQGIITLLNIMRSRNWRICILTQHPDRISKALRSERADYLVQLDERKGDAVRAVVGRKDNSPTWWKSTGRWRGFVPDRANTLTWPSLENTPVWREYLLYKYDMQDTVVSEVKDMFERVRNEERNRLLKSRHARTVA